MNWYPPVVEASGSAAQPAPAPVERELPFKFTGNAREYFRIWIVNLLLTVVTLGVYSAWAKVRSRQYFYRNTWLDGTSFEYTANPIAVLKGRILAALVLGLVFGSQHYSLPLYIGSVLLLVLATPWVLVKALAFNARNSSYRNIRFAFTGRTGEAAGLYLGMLLVYVVTCGLGMPYAQWRMTSFVITRHLYGDLRPRWTTTSGDYYRMYLITLLLALPAYVVLFGVILAARKVGADPADSAAAMQLVMIPTIVAVYAYLLVPGAFLKARQANVLWGGIEVGPHRLESTQRMFELLKLYVVNLLGIVVSLGLLIPWAKIRLARYRAGCLRLHAVGPLTAESLFDEEVGAAGDGLSDLGDFDVGLGV